MDAVMKARLETERSVHAVQAALDQFVKRAHISAFVIVKKVGFRIMAAIVKLSPVDTGRFRAAWTAAARLLGVQVTPAPNPVAGALGALEGSASLTRGETRIEFVARNSVRYAPLVEAGVSPKAPAGVVSKAIRQEEARLLQELRQLPEEAAK